MMYDVTVQLQKIKNRTIDADPSVTKSMNVWYKQLFDFHSYRFFRNWSVISDSLHYGH
jgi:hypothetical protein